MKFLRKNWVRDLIALAILGLAVLAFFWPVLLGKGWIPRGGGDSVSFIYPMYRFAAQSFWSGTIPLWNPFQYAGQPFISDNQSGIFYPFNLLLFLFNPDFSYRAVEGLVLWHFFFAGAAMYFCMRLLNPDKRMWRPAAVVGSLAFMFSGVFIAHIGNLNLIAVSAWLPISFLAFHRAIEAGSKSQRWAWAAAAAVSTGLSTLAGHGQMTFILAAFLGLYAVYRAVTDRGFRPLLLLLFVGILSVALSAVNIFPSLAGVQHTVRSGFGGAAALDYALPWKGLLGMFAPDFFGRGEVEFWGGWPRVEYGYVGVLTLFLASLGTFYRRDRLTFFLSLAGLLFLLLALGPYTPLYPFLLDVLPWFPFQVPARFILLVDFCLAALAALGLDGLRQRQWSLKPFFIFSAIAAALIMGFFTWQYRQNIHDVPHHQQQMITAILFFLIMATASWLLLLAAYKNWLPKKTIGILAILLLGFDLIFLGWSVEIDWNDPMPGFAGESPALALLKEDQGIHRVEIASGAWQPNLAQLEGLYSIDGVYNPLELSNYAAYIGSIGYRGSPLYNLLGTKYIIGGKKDPPGDTNFILPIYENDPDVTVFLNTLALPRVNMVYKNQIVSDHDEAFAAIHEENFDPLEAVVLETGQPMDQEAGQSSITILRYDPNLAVFEVTTDKSGYFLLSDIFHPDWQAAVNGQEIPILQADYALRAVLLETGTNLVEMRYQPPSWTWGSLLSLLTWLLLLLIIITWILYRRKNRKTKQ